ncbi:MAG TPA: hypothetical protein VGG39_33650 [Polyangiaceae bacterium]|jgi:hypothetical protein
MTPQHEEAGALRRDALFALIGALLGAACTGACFSAFLWAPRHATASQGVQAAAETGRSDGDSPVDDPAMEANANLVASLRACSQKLTALQDDEARMERDRESEVDASQAARARRMARREPSPDDWKQMASTGTVRYFLPCGAFEPAPELLDRLGLAPRDVPAVQSAFAAARQSAWSQIRPLCAAAAGTASTADRLGLESCPQVILDAARAADGAATDRAMRSVGAVRAGLADPSTIAADDAVGVAFLALTGVAREAETRLVADLGPDEAHAVVYANGGCGRTAEFR